MSQANFGEQLIGEDVTVSKKKKKRMMRQNENTISSRIQIIFSRDISYDFPLT